MKSKIIIVSGYFNPIHKGHLEYFIHAKEKGDLLFVIVNSDHQRALKGSKEFQNEDERHRLVGLTSWGVIAEFWQHTDASNPSNEDDIVKIEDDYFRGE